jgi:uncharacterized protein (TIGR02466 family)
MNLETWFAIPIWNDVIELPDTQNQEAIKFCLKLREQSPGRTLSNVGGWQSNDLYENELVCSPLQFLLPVVTAACQNALKAFGSKRKIIVSNSWINMSDRGNYNILHYHSNCDLVCVFYLTENNSAIKFDRPFDVPRYYLSQLGSSCNTALSYSNVVHTPPKNALLVFPSWLQHSVEASQSDTVRISITMNMKAVDE